MTKVNCSLVAAIIKKSILIQIKLDTLPIFFLIKLLWRYLKSKCLGSFKRKVLITKRSDDFIL